MRKFFLLLILNIYNISICQSKTSDCTPDFILVNSENNINFIYNAQNSITTERNYNVVASNDEIKMRAGNIIILKPDTHIKKGSLFSAQIRPCTLCESTFSYPNFFTPNVDGFNDFWKVNWSNEIEFSEVSIFDRYGNLIKILKNPNDFWDGTFNSNQVFSSDYWFKFTYIDCNGNKKEYKSHFTLKR